MRRATNLFSQILDYENLRLAFHRAARGKHAVRAVRSFSSRMEDVVPTMAQQLSDRTFPLGRFHQFLIRDPKERIITAPCFEERVVHHAIMNVCEPTFDRWLIDDTFACRIGKGREAAVLRARQFAHRFGWYAKLDVCKFFDSVPHNSLICLLRRRIKDEQLLDLLERIIRSFRRAIRVGLPIGSLTSQHLANFYLSWCDRFVKEDLRLRGYVRYMDDLVLWGSSCDELEGKLTSCRNYLGRELLLAVKPAAPTRSDRGLSFLGCCIFPSHIVLNRRSKKRWRRRVRLLESANRMGLLSEQRLQQCLEAATAFAQSARTCSWRFRRAVLQSSWVGDP